MDIKQAVFILQQKGNLVVGVDITLQDYLLVKPQLLKLFPGAQECGLKGEATFQLCLQTKLSF